MANFNVKTIRKSLSLAKMVSLDTLNVRLEENYDLVPLETQIRQRGGIMVPLMVEPCPSIEGHFQILKGNRRFRAAQNIVADPNCPAALRDALIKLECDVIDQPIDDKTRLSLILDHGESKGLTRLEVVYAVWRLDAQMYSTSAIGEMLYYQLAQYSGNTKKLGEYHAITDPRKRKEATDKWFRGTLDNKILLANRLGDYVREQFILTSRAEDGPLPEGVMVDMTLDQARLSALRKAKEADFAAGGWDPVNGGENFNAKVEQFKEETAGKREKTKTDTRPTASALKAQATSVYKSGPIRAALMTAAGENSYGAGLVEMDKAIYRWSLVTEVIGKAVSQAATPEMRALLMSLIGDGPAADVETALVPFLTSDQGNAQS